MKKPVALIILDGYGISEEKKGNAITEANTPYIDMITAKCPSTTIGASGLDVGLPDGQMGNSEVGHTNMGAGRTVYQELTRITKSIKDGDFFDIAELKNAMQTAKDNNKSVHLMGLLSDGGVHSHVDHLYGLLEMAKKIGVKDLFVHGFTDGRDVAPSSAKSFVENLEAKMKELGIGQVGTLAGRYYGMDRDTRWERVEEAYNAMVCGEGEKASTGAEAIANSYANEKTDEFVPATVVDGYKPVQEGDSMIFFNFRPDRAREITRTFVDEAFDGFTRKKGFIKVNFVCFTQYDATMPNVQVAFKPQSLNNTLGEYLSKNGKTQLRIAETEKYAHVTFFFNGGVEEEFEGETRELVKSPDVATYDLQPEMSANELCDKVVDCVNSDKYDVIILNYANCDMVGHTGIFDAAVKAVESVDMCLSKTVEAITAKGGIALVTADHGNADKMFEPDGSPFTAHTTNVVPLIMVGADPAYKLKSGGKLADLAPTMLELMDMAIPAEMDGKSLLEK